MSAHRFGGGCHCGNVDYVFKASGGLDALGLRACQCSFCRAHGARTTSDPNGTIRIVVHDASKLARYRFGLRTADFLLCAQCGVFIGAVMEEDGRQWMTVNANTFKPPPAADFPLVPHEYGVEAAAGRIARRKARWTPISEIQS
jgi:hypothetical protein